MEEARKKLRVCLICVVAAAIIAGLAYYIYDRNMQSQVNDGTLVRITEVDVRCL